MAWFNPMSLRVLRGRRADFRSHRKIVVCDGRVGFTGGINIADEHSAEFRGAKAWRDTHLRIEGSAVRALQRVFPDDWYFATEKLPERAPGLFPHGDGTPGERIVQILASGPGSARCPIHRSFFTAIDAASTRLYVTTPYFIPVSRARGSRRSAGSTTGAMRRGRRCASSSRGERRSGVRRRARIRGRRGSGARSRSSVGG